MPRPKQNLYGQEMGNKGLQTREKVVAATAELLVRQPLRGIKVAEICQRAGVSTSTFYLYFETVGDAALAAVEQVEQASPKVIDLLQQKWTRENLFDNSRQLVNHYFAIWDKHHALLRVRNFVADEGDRNFIDARRRSIEPVHFLLQEKIREMQAHLPEEWRLDPPSTASVVLAMLERTAQVIRLRSAHKATRPRSVETAAFLVACALGGPFSPAEGVVQAEGGEPATVVT